MSRRHAAPKRKVIPDPKYINNDIAKFINYLMHDGKKSIAEAILYDALDISSKKLKKDPLEIFGTILENLAPAVEVKSRRVGGANYQVPVEVQPNRSKALAMRWLAEFSRKRKEKSMAERLAAEMQEAFEKRGSAMKKREEVHRMAEANKAFSHFRF